MEPDPLRFLKYSQINPITFQWLHTVASIFSLIDNGINEKFLGSVDYDGSRVFRVFVRGILHRRLVIKFRGDKYGKWGGTPGRDKSYVENSNFDFTTSTRMLTLANLSPKRRRLWVDPIVEVQEWIFRRDTRILLRPLPLNIREGAVPLANSDFQFGTILQIADLSWMVGLVHHRAGRGYLACSQRSTWCFYSNPQRLFFGHPE